MGLEGLDQVITNIANKVVEVKRRGQPGLKLAGQAMANDIKALAPLGKDPKTGPHGTYRRSIHVEPSDNMGHPVVYVGTDLPQARRLEYGFNNMTDSLGRTYHQLPQPHFRPVIDTEMPKYVAIINGELASSFGEFDKDLGMLVASAIRSEDMSK
jgi:hypothetical protein